MKKLISILGILALIIIAFMATGNFWLRQAIQAAVTGVTGFPLKIKQVRLDLMASKIGIYGLELKNPKGFPQGRFASVPEIYVDFELKKFLFEHKLYFQEIRLNIEEVAIVRNQNGETNLAQLKALTKSERETLEETKKVKKASSPAELDFFIDRLVLTIRHLRYQDQSHSLVGQKSIDLHIDGEVFRGISNPSDIVRIIVLKIVYKSAIGNLGVPVTQLKEHVTDSLERGQALALQGSELARQAGVQALDQGTQLVEQTSQNIQAQSAQVKETIEGARDKAKSVFSGAGSWLKSTTESIQEKARSAG